jgi:hypothetical protein
MCKEAMEDMKVLVVGEIFHTHENKNSRVVLVVNEMFLSQHLFNEDGDNPLELLKGKQLEKVMDKFMPLCSSNACNFIASFKHNPNNTS